MRQNWNSKIDIVLVLVLFFQMTAPDLLLAERPSQYIGHELNKRLEAYSGVSIELTPRHSSFVRGQQIHIDFTITCAFPRSQPWMEGEVGPRIILLRDGVPVSHRYVLLNFPKDENITNTVFTGSVLLSGEFYDEITRQEIGFAHLLPGNYVGYFDDGVVSPEFEFVVEPVPDSLRSLWNDYCSLKQKRFGGRRSDGRAILSEISRLAERFHQLPAGSTWRVEALEAALMGYGSHRSDWNNRDKEKCSILIVDLCNETECSDGVLLSSTLNSILRNVPAEERADALEALASEIDNERFAEVARESVASMREQQRGVQR